MTPATPTFTNDPDDLTRCPSSLALELPLQCSNDDGHDAAHSWGPYSWTDDQRETPMAMTDSIACRNTLHELCSGASCDCGCHDRPGCLCLKWYADGPCVCDLEDGPR